MRDITMTGPNKKQEEEWQTEDDARTIQRMGEIMSDSKRHERAKKKAEEMKNQMENSIKTMEMMSSAKMVYDKTDSMKKKK